MNYYERHLGDYARDAGHLSMLEHGAYTLLLDRYYTTEKPIPADQAHRVCRARTKEEREAVDAVLSEFFTLENGAWINGRANREVLKMQAKVDAARTNGQRGGRPKKNPAETNEKPGGFLPGSDLETQTKALQSPDTSNTPIPPEGGKRSGPVGLKAWLEAIKAKGEKAIPEGHAVFVYAEEVGIPSEMLALAWAEFRHRYTQPDAKRYRDWRIVFLKAVRGNWLKLWFVGADGAYGLTTVGHQAQRAHDQRRAA